MDCRLEYNCFKYVTGNIFFWLARFMNVIFVQVTLMVSNVLAYKYDATDDVVVCEQASFLPFL